MDQSGVPAGREAGDQQRLRIGRGPWGSFGEGLYWSRPKESFRSDVLVVGAGITGSLIAQHLAHHGLKVVVVDRLAPGQGSTCASTAMLQWEIDTSLTELADLYGFQKAASTYRQSYEAVQGLRHLVEALGIPCDLKARRALYLAGATSGPEDIENEHAIRKAAGLPSHLLDLHRLKELYGIDRAAALLSDDAAEADPLRLSQALLALALRRGAMLVHDEVDTYDFDAHAARVRLASGTEIEAGHVILATGYVMPPFVKPHVARASASWAAVTAPESALGFWPDRCLVWEDATPYLYARTTADDRILVGGEDEAMDDPLQRDESAPAKAARMHEKMEHLWGRRLPPFESVWSASFSETEDGMPLIGSVPGAPRCYAAYGYGGNGITYSFLASRMIGSFISNTKRPWFEFFALDRPSPRS